MPHPLFFSFDGMDGSGKSTQITQFANLLQKLGHEVLVCRDPGSTELGEKLRELLLQCDGPLIHRRAEMFLYMAARAQLVEEIIRPALAGGKTVISDRFLLANVVYQGHAGGLDVATLWNIGQFATGELEPDMTFVLDLSPDQAFVRINRRLDRMEQQGEEFRNRLRSGFLREAERNPAKVKIIDATGSEQQVASDVRTAAAGLLNDLSE